MRKRHIVYGLLIWAIGLSCGMPLSENSSSFEQDRALLEPKNQIPSVFAELRSSQNRSPKTSEGARLKFWAKALPHIQRQSYPPMPLRNQQMSEAALSGAHWLLTQNFSNAQVLRRSSERWMSVSSSLDPSEFGTVNDDMSEIGDAILDTMVLLAGDHPECAIPQGADVFYSESSLKTIAVEGNCDGQSVSEPTWYEGYCVEEHWVETSCYDTWLCEGGDYAYDGYYDWVCDGEDCDYEWVEELVWVDDCQGGYWEEECRDGYQQEGYCFDGAYFDVGRSECFESYVTEVPVNSNWHYQDRDVPFACEEIRNAQRRVLQALFLEFYGIFQRHLPPLYDAAFTDLFFDSSGFSVRRERYYAAAIAFAWGLATKSPAPQISTQLLGPSTENP